MMAPEKSEQEYGGLSYGLISLTNSYPCFAVGIRLRISHQDISIN